MASFSEVEYILRLLLLRWLGCAKVVLSGLLRCPERIKWILTGRALWLVSLHAHGHSHATHHIHLLLLASHRHSSLAHHGLEATHHGLEPAPGWLLLAHLAEGIAAGQVLSLELVGLRWLLLLLLSL